MKSSNDLLAFLRAIDHKGYPAYKSLAGSYQFENFILCIDHVQGDPSRITFQSSYRGAS